MIDALKRLLAPLVKRINTIVSRVLVQSVSDAGTLQLAKISLLADEVMENLERIQNYGMTSVPPDGSEGVALFPGGNREHGIIVAIDNRQVRIKGLTKGEVAIFTDEGDKIYFKRGNTIEIDSAGMVKITAPAVEILGPTAITGAVTITGNLVVTGTIAASGAIGGAGDVSDAGGTVSALRGSYNSHKHVEHNIAGGKTDSTDTPA